MLFTFVELLRKDAEHTLMDMAQLLFSRLPQFKEDSKWAVNMKKVHMYQIYNLGLKSV